MKIQSNPIVLLGSLGLILLLSSCISGGGGQTAAIDQEKGVVESSVPGVEKIELNSPEDISGKKIAGNYNNLSIADFSYSEQIQTDYPNAGKNCKASILKQLKEKKNYLSVSGDSKKKMTGKTAAISLKIVDMRITSSTARMWGGAFAGSSFMDVLLTIKDNKTGKTVHEKVLSTSNNSWAAAYSGGTSDKALPADFGILIGEYIYTVVSAAK